MSAHMSTHMSTHMFMIKSVRMSTHMSIHNSILMSTSMFMHVPLNMSIYMSIHMPMAHVSPNVDWISIVSSRLARYIMTEPYTCLHTCPCTWLQIYAHGSTPVHARGYKCLHTCPHAWIWTWGMHRHLDQLRQVALLMVIEPLSLARRRMQEGLQIL